MNLGRGFWIPSTPDKPVSQFDAPQIQIGEENWKELIGFYNEVLQNDTCDVLHPQGLDLNSHVPNDDEIQRVVPVETYNTLQQHSNPTMVFGLDISGQNGQNVVSNSNNATGCGMEDFGEFFGTPNKINSLAELMGMPRAPNSGSSTNVSSVGAEFQNHVLHSNRDVGGCNLQEMTNSRLPVHNFNLNLPPIPEACETSSVQDPSRLDPLRRAHKSRPRSLRYHIFSQTKPQLKKNAPKIVKS